MQDSTVPTLDQAPVAELLQLMARLIGEDLVKARAATYRTWQNDPHRAREMAMCIQAERLDSLLGGVLSPGAGGVTDTGIAWGVERARQLVAELETAVAADVAADAFDNVHVAEPAAGGEQS